MSELLFNPLIGFIYGSLMGSFANVCIWRIPREESVVKPGSYCPKCGKGIALYNNIPFVSYILLGGRCRSCSSRISLRYPFIELLTALITASWFLRFSSWTAAIIFSFFGLLLVILSGIDFEHFYLPPQLTYSLIIAGPLVAYWNPMLETSELNPIITSIAGIIAGGGVIIAIRWLGSIAFKKEAMGLGDVKLMMGIAAFTGPSGLFWTIFIGSIIGAMVGITLILSSRMSRDQYLPFGPYLAAGSMIYIYFSRQIHSIFYF